MAEGDQGSSDPSTTQKVLGGLLALVLLAGVGFLIYEVLPNGVTNAKNPSFIDNIFANPVVLLFARIALMAGAIYVVVSVFALMGGRRWLAELGPLKASDPIARLDRNAELLQRELQDAVGTIRDLEQRLEESDSSLASARSDIDLLLDHIDTIESEKETR